MMKAGWVVGFSGWLTGYSNPYGLFEGVFEPDGIYRQTWNGFVQAGIYDDRRLGHRVDTLPAYCR